MTERHARVAGDDYHVGEERRATAKAIGRKLVAKVHLSKHRRIGIHPRHLGVRERRAIRKATKGATVPQWLRDADEHATAAQWG